jgi:hypothetical protein
VPYAERPFAFCLDGYPEVRGTTDEDGFAILESPPAGAQGHIDVWPDDEVPKDKVSWDINIAPIDPPGTPLGASTRLANLDYFAGEPTDQMTDDLRDAISYFESDTEGLEITGELNQLTCNKLRGLHECQAGRSVDDKAAGAKKTTT